MIPLAGLHFVGRYTAGIYLTKLALRSELAERNLLPVRLQDVENIQYLSGITGYLASANN